MTAGHRDRDEHSLAVVIVYCLISALLGALISMLGLGQGRGQVDSKMRTCAEFTGVTACECWVKDNCGKDYGRSAAKFFN